MRVMKVHLKKIPASYILKMRKLIVRIKIGIIYPQKSLEGMVLRERERERERDLKVSLRKGLLYAST